MYCVSYLVCDNVYVFDSYKLTLPPDASIEGERRLSEGRVNLGIRQ